MYKSEAYHLDCGNISIRQRISLRRWDHVFVRCMHAVYAPYYDARHVFVLLYECTKCCERVRIGSVTSLSDDLSSNACTFYQVSYYTCDEYYCYMLPGTTSEFGMRSSQHLLYVLCKLYA